MTIAKSLRMITAATLTASCACGAALAETAAEFYNGETITAISAAGAEPDFSALAA